MRLLGKEIKPRVIARHLVTSFLLAVAMAMTTIPVMNGYVQAQGLNVPDVKAPTQKEINDKRQNQRKPIENEASFALAEGVTNPTLSATTEKGKQTLTNGVPPVTAPKNHEKGEEKTAERTPQSRTYKAKGGGEVIETSADVQNYKDDNGKLKPIVKSALEDLDYQKRNKVSESLWERLTPGSPQPVGFKNEEGSIKTYFETLGKGGIRMVHQGKELSMKPRAAAANIKPERIKEDKLDYIAYKSVWKNVDIWYEYKGTSVKENIILNSKPETNKFTFDLQGAKASVNPKDPNTLLLDGPFKDKLIVGPLTLDVNKKGPVDSKPLKQYPSKDGSQLIIEIDQKWLNGQPKDAFPIVIDPPIHDVSGIPGGYWGDFVCHKSDGVSIGSNNCNLNTGGLNDNGLKTWRSLVRLPYDQLNGRQLLGADLYLYMMPPGSPGWAGYYEGRTVNVTWAQCNGYHCVSGAPHMSAVIGADGVINVAPLLHWMQQNVGYGGYLILWGEEWHTGSFKAFHGDHVKLHMYTNQYPSQPSPELPSNNPNQEVVVTTTEPQLKVSKSHDPNGDQVYYEFVVRSTNNNVVWASGGSPGRQATVPEGVLQDGATYKWEYHYNDGYWGNGPINGGTFKVDLRSGKDKSQTYDEMGPLSVSLNNGNVHTSVKTHAMSALGGDIGLSLDYNSPFMARKGLEAQYYANNNFTGNPQYRRVDSNINYDWDLGSPVSGVIPADNFSVRWNGYFVAPETGDYYFGGANDDFMSMTVNGNAVFSFEYNPNGAWSAAPVHLQKGETAEIYIWFAEYVGAARTELKVKGAVPEQIIPTEWLRTKPMPTDAVKGLTGHYYRDNGSHDPSQLSDAKFMVRDDPTVNFSWAENAPAPGAPNDNFYVHWEGYFTAPAAGTYKFGVGGDDGVKVAIDGIERASLWSAHAYQEQYDPAGILLTAGQTVKVDMDYYDTVGHSKVKLLLDGPTGIGDIDPKFLTRGSKAAPAGWSVSGDASGDLAYERINIRQNGDALVQDSDGTSWLFTNTGSGYKPPVNEDATLVKNSDGTHTLTDVDGRVYVFNVDGTLKMTSAPVDDRTPAALKYSYTTQNGIPKPKTITDPVTSGRSGTLYYGGDAGCRTPYDGLEQAPTGMICGFETTDGRYTQFMYYSGRLGVVSNPGWADTSLSYDENGTLDGWRDAMTEDAVYAGQRPDDEFSYHWIWYDELGRSTGMESAKPTTGGERLEHWIEYLPGVTKRHAINAPEPAGYTQYIEYDNLLRTTKSCDNTAKCSTTLYHATKDLVMSTTDALGLKTVNHYDDEDRLTHNYGPVPQDWFDPNTRQPIVSKVDQTPHNETRYDENIVGPAVAYHDYEGNINPAGKLYDGPKLHTTGINTATPGVLQKTWTTAPITVGQDREGWGVSMTGKLRLPAAGTYQIKATHDDGVKVWIDDQLIINNWSNNSVRDSFGSFNHTAGQVHRLKVEYYNVPNTPVGDASFMLSLKQDGGFDWTTNWANYLKPGYSLVAGTTSHDVQLTNTVTATSYLDPAYGTLQNATVDPTGINYQTSATYEAPGTGFLRQLSRTSPGGSVTQYTHYGANETKDNPCTTGTTEAFKQAGFAKGRIDPDPDGTGAGVARQVETIYDATGRPVANRTGTDAWTCTSYDERGRVTQIVIPTVGVRTGRTVTYTYDNGGNPLATKINDANGYTVTTVDLLGRVVKFRDASGNVTDTTYNSIGQVSQRVSKLGTETYTYDDYGRLTSYKLDNVTLAIPAYDEFSRVTQIEYPTVKDAGTNQTLKLNNPTRDDLQRITGLSYTLPGGQQLSNNVTLSQSGAILDESINGVDLSPGVQAYQYDKGGRLTQASVAGHTYQYGFGAPNAACASKNGNFANAGKNSNRMSYSVDGAATWYCYDAADRLIASSDTKYDAPTYDNHGNTLTLGTGATTTTFKYDQSDRNTEISEGTAKKIVYKRDHDNRIIQRAVTNAGTTTNYYYGMTGGSNYTFMWTNNTTKEVVEKYLSLPGGVSVTLRPLETTTAAKTKASLRNLHGDTMATLNGNGANENGVLLYEPFGTQITPTSAFAAANPGVAFATATPPSNMQGGQSAAWAGAHRRSGEVLFTAAPMQMGERVYIPSLGRFLSVDSVEGGTQNNYVYVNDPINNSDYSGQFAIALGGFAAFAGAIIAAAPVVLVAAAVIVVAAVAYVAYEHVMSRSATSSSASTGGGGGGGGGSGGSGGTAGPGSSAPKGGGKAPKQSKNNKSGGSSSKSTPAPKYNGYRPSDLTFAGNALKSFSQRPYQYKGVVTLIRLITASAPNVADKYPHLSKWILPGTVNGTDGKWELVLDLAKNEIVHFLFRRN